MVVIMTVRGPARIAGRVLKMMVSNVDARNDLVLYSATMNEESLVLEIRIFTVHSGTRQEFDRITREGTIPLMRRLGINVVTYGPSPNNDDGYHLLRAFRSEEERVTLSQSLYASEEWDTKYDAPIGAMIADYRTTVLTTTPEIVDQLKREAQRVARVTG
jgi:hypothetical protein